MTLRKPLKNSLASAIGGAFRALSAQIGPKFTSGRTATAIAENTGAGTVIYTAATASETDTLTFSGTDASLFSFDAATGEVTLLADADYETQSSYSFTITATDTEGNSTAQTVTLPVTNLDEVAPVFTSGTTAIAIDENTGAGSVIYIATVDDSADTSGGVTFSLSGTDSALFSIDENTGAVTLLADADYETQSSYSFDVTATDAAGNSTTQTVTLAVNDLDEIAPVFTSSASANIDDGTTAGEVVYTATTDDATATLTISGPDASAFSFDAATGELTLLADADYATQSSYSFTITATDPAGNSDDLAVTLTVNEISAQLYPDDVQSIVAAWDVRYGVSQSGGLVSGLTDLTGGGADLTQPTGANQSNYLASDPQANGLPTIYNTSSDGRKGLLNTEKEITFRHLYLLMAHNADTFAGYEQFFGVGSTTPRALGLSGTADLYTGGSAPTVVTVSINGGSPTATVLARPYSVVKLIGEYDITMPASNTSAVLHSAAADGRSLNGRVTAMYAVSADETAADETRIVGFLTAEGGL